MTTSIQPSTHACRLCSGQLMAQFSLAVLNKHQIQYYQCIECLSLQTEPAYWLAEAYDQNLQTLILEPSNVIGITFMSSISCAIFLNSKTCSILVGVMACCAVHCETTRLTVMCKMPMHHQRMPKDLQSLILKFRI
jgi:hypothetical protein